MLTFINVSRNVYEIITFFIPTEPHTSTALQTQTLDRKKPTNNMRCLATVHGPTRGRNRSTIHRPRGPTIEQLIVEECGELPLNRSQDDDSEDPDDM